VLLDAREAREGSLFEETGPVPAESRDFRSVPQETAFQVDISSFVCYMPAFRVKGQLFAALTLPEFLSDQLKEDAACRFSSAITMSISPQGAEEEDAARGYFPRDEARGHYEKPSEKKAREKAEAVPARASWPARSCSAKACCR
jgi:hypothetical protein